MPKASPIKTSFNAGEWSPIMQGHINLQKFPDSGELYQNIIPLKQGPIVRRGGTRFVKEVKNSANNTVLIPFESSDGNSYLIEAGDSYFRFYRDGAVITHTANNIIGATQANPVVVTTATNHTYNVGEEVFIENVVGMTELNNKYYRVGVVTPTTLQLQDVDSNNIDGTSYGAYVSGGDIARVYEVSSPYFHTDWLGADFAQNYQHVQSGDVLYLAVNGKEISSLSRISDSQWEVNTINFDDGPYLAENLTETTLDIDKDTPGEIAIVDASSTVGINNDQGFLLSDVGRLIRWQDESGNWTWLKITSYVSNIQVNAMIMGDKPADKNPTVHWRLGLFSLTTGYPTVISLVQGRVFLAGGTNYPDTYALTRKGGYDKATYYFAPSDFDGTVTDDAGFTDTLDSRKRNRIAWATEDDKGVIMGTGSREWLLRGRSSDGVLTHESSAKPFSSIGSASIQPVEAERGTIFMQRARRRMYDIFYSFEQDGLSPRDITIASEHITSSGVCQVVFQPESINSLWARNTNGLLFGMVYYPAENVFAAHRHILGGQDIRVRSLAVIPNPSGGTSDQLWLVVERTVNGITRKYIEFMTDYFRDDMLDQNAFHVDSGLSYNGSPTSTLTGLDHLEGETVKLIVDGKSHPDLIVTNGAVTLANNVTGSIINVGLGFTWAFLSQRMEAGAADGVSQGKTKRITNIAVRVYKTLGLYYGSSQTKFDEYDFNQGQNFDESTALFTGDIETRAFPGGYETEGRIYLGHDGVFPAAILAIMPQLVTFDR